MAAEEIKDRDSFRAWLETQSRGVGVLMAARAALRVLPLFSRFATKAKSPRQFADLTASLFRANALARVAGTYPTRAKELDAAAADADAAFAAAADAAASAAFASAAAADAAFASAAVDAASAAAAVDAASAAAAADAAFASAAAASADAWANLREDADIFERRGMSALIYAPLWSVTRPAWAADAWAALQSTLPKGEDWDVWTVWYEDRFTGNNYSEARELIFATVPRDVWDKGSKAANAWIRRELDEIEGRKPIDAAPGDPEAATPKPLSRNAVAPKTRAALSVLFSYAWHPNVTQQRAQLDLYERLTDLINQKPPQYESLPRIELWRDAKRLENAHDAEAQIISACDKAFLLLALMSRKYPGSGGCMMEFDRFVDDDGVNLPRKQAIVVAVNCKADEVSARFSSPLRIWMLDDGKTLLEASRRSEANKDHFAHRVAEQIWIAARRHLDGTTSQSASARSPESATVEHKLEPFANKRAWNEYEINDFGRIEFESGAERWQKSSRAQASDRNERLEACKLLAQSLASDLERGKFGKYRNAHALGYLQAYVEYVPTSNFAGNLTRAKHQVDFLRKELNRCRLTASPQFVDQAETFISENLGIWPEAPIAKDVAEFAKQAPDRSPVPEDELAAIPEALGKKPALLAFEPDVQEALQMSLGADRPPDGAAAGSARAYEIGTTLNRLVKVLDIGSKLNGSISAARLVLMPLIEKFLDNWPLYWPF